MTAFKAYNEIINFISAGVSPAQIVEFRPSKETQNRIEELINKERVLQLSVEEKSELDHYLVLEHLIRLAKAKARQHLS